MENYDIEPKERLIARAKRMSPFIVLAKEVAQAFMHIIWS